MHMKKYMFMNERSKMSNFLPSTTTIAVLLLLQLVLLLFFDKFMFKLLTEEFTEAIARRPGDGSRRVVVVVAVAAR